GPEPRNKLKPESITRIRAKLNEKKLELTNNAWQFLPDSANSGLKLGYEKADFDDSSWKPIKIGQHWEGQGYPALDGWAWYRIKIDIPGDWLKDSLFLNTEGIDDAYEIYFNGKKMASGGDMPRKLTAFDERKAHTVPHEVINPDGKNVIAIRVFDWYGAGGIHRPITISNVPVGGIDIIK
ncbi:MAG TPA: hypothetical protein PKD72_14550, partial [Gemmatales bacterium]|nr:hypothetical protein [Gemmatales bacterium]